MRREVASYESLCLNRLERFDDLIETVVTRCLADGGLVGMLPISNCAAILDKAKRRKLAGKLSTPILLDLYSRHVDTGSDAFRFYAYEDFLLAHGLERPSQLVGIVDQFDRPQFIYYLRYICIPSVMQTSSAFQGTRELEDERLAVVSLLVKIDPDQAKIYETEIREITRTQLIRRGVRRVEQSKIFVDLPAIRRWPTRTLGKDSIDTKPSSKRA